MRYAFFIGDDVKYLHMGWEEILRLLYRLDVRITIPLWEPPLVQYHNQGRNQIGCLAVRFLVSFPLLRHIDADIQRLVLLSHQVP